MAKIIGTKVCPKCTGEKPATKDFFHRCGGSRTGLKAYCIDCDRKIGAEYYRRNRDRRIKQVRRWQMANATRAKSYQKQRREITRTTH